MEDLPKESLESFRRVVVDDAHTFGSKVKTRSHLKQKMEGQESIRIVLRSGGLNFPSEDYDNAVGVGDESKQPPTPRPSQQSECSPKSKNKNQSHLHPRKTPKLQFVVALAHHQPTDVFLLFCLSPTTIPCRCVRFDRNGNYVDPLVRREEDRSWKTIWEDRDVLKWNKDDACALATAINYIQKNCEGYFGMEEDGHILDSEIENANEKSGAADCYETMLCHAKCLRLVSDSSKKNPSDEEESMEDQREDIHAIRSLILDSLLGSKLSTSLKFRHPDPKYLLSLSQAISNELHGWRRMCRDAALLCRGYMEDKKNDEGSNPIKVKTIGGISKTGPDSKDAVEGQVTLSPKLWTKFEQFEEKEKNDILEVINGREKNRQSCMAFCKSVLIKVREMADEKMEIMGTYETEVPEPIGPLKNEKDKNEQSQEPKTNPVSENSHGQSICHQMRNAMRKKVIRRLEKWEKEEGNDNQKEKTGDSQTNKPKQRKDDLHYQFALKFGKEIVGSVTSLDYIQKFHKKFWISFHPALEYAIESKHVIEADGDIRYRDGGDNGVFAPWVDSYVENRMCLVVVPLDEASQKSCDNESKEAVKSTADADTKGKQNGDDEDSRMKRIDDAAKSLVRLWEAEDFYLLDFLTQTIAEVEKVMKSLYSKPFITLGDTSTLKEVPVKKYLQAVEHEMESFAGFWRQLTVPDAVKMVELWNNKGYKMRKAKSNPWDKKLVGTHWTDWESEAFLSFGRSIWHGSRSKHGLATFVLDHTKLSIGMEGCMGDLISNRARISDRSGYFDDNGPRSKELFEECWKNVFPMLNGAEEMAKRYLREGDLVNSAVLIFCCSRVLCQKGTAAKMLKAFHVEEDFVIMQIQKSMKPLDMLAIQISLAFINWRDNHFSFDAQWFDIFLKSGAIYFPTAEKGKVSWKFTNFSCWEKEPCYRVDCHVASAIFTHNGWSHPILSEALNGDDAAIKRWSQMEAPSVIKERFFAMKREKSACALSLARMLEGDYDAMEYFLSHGDVNSAIEQAGSSENIECLAHLGSCVIASNPCASLQCIHGIIQLSLKGNTHCVIPVTSIDIVVDLFLSKIFKSNANDSLNSPAKDAHKWIHRKRVPSLQLLGTMAFCQSALDAAGSDETLQNLLEKKNVAVSGICLASVAITIVARSVLANSNKVESMKYLLQKSGLFFSESNEYSGILTKLDSVSTPIEKKNMLDICCAVYQSSKFLIRHGCPSVYCFEMGLFSAINVAWLSGCDGFAMEFLQSILDRDEDSFETSVRSPLNCITACFSHSFCSTALKGNPQLLETLLETFLKTRWFLNEDAKKVRIWVVVGLLHLGMNPEKIASGLVDHIVLNCRKNFHENKGRACVKAFRAISVVDKSANHGTPLSSKDHTMSLFASSPQRMPVTEAQRQHICSSLLSNFFQSTTLDPSMIAECIRIDRSVRPSFWRVDANQVKIRLNEHADLDCYLSQEVSLRHTCAVLFFVDFSIGRNETWCTSCFILVIGLKWLRKMLVSGEDLVQFDRGENADKFIFDLFNEDWRSLFRPHDWVYIRNGNEGNAYHYLDDKPMFQARALIAVVRAHSRLVMHSAPLSNLCQEALTLCSALDFLVEPTSQRLESYSVQHRSFKTVGPKLPSCLEPSNMADFVMQESWSSKPNFSTKRLRSEKEHNMFEVPSLLQRVSLAVKHGKLKLGMSLCVRAGEADGLWNKIASVQSGSNSIAKYTRELLQGCLLILVKLASDEEQIGASERFVDITLHLILTMNWFRCCWNCRESCKDESRNSTKLVPSVGNVSALELAALVWNKLSSKNKKKSSEKLSFCFDVLSRVHRCCAWLKDQHLYTVDGTCHYCKFKTDNDTDVQPQVRSKQTKKRKRDTSKNVESDFRDLEKFTSQLGLKDQSNWCFFALQEYCVCRKNSPVGKQSKK